MRDMNPWRGQTGSRLPGVARWGGRALFVASFVVGAWELISGGGVFRLAGIEISAHSSERPFLFAAVLGLILCFTDAPLRAGLVRVARRSQALQSTAGLLRSVMARFRVLGWPARGAMVIVVIGLFGNASSWFEVIEARRLLHAKSRNTARTGLVGHGAQEHLTVLVEAVVRERLPGGCVVYIHGDDARGHLSAYYCYPRLIYMEPTMRRWSLASRMLRTGEVDPCFKDPGARPLLEETRRFAEERGLPVLEVWPDRARFVLGRPPEAGS